MISNKSKGRHRVHIYKLKHWRVLRKCSAWKIPQKMLSPNFASSICFFSWRRFFFFETLTFVLIGGGKLVSYPSVVNVFFFGMFLSIQRVFFLTDLGSSKLVPPVNRWNFRRSRMSFQQKWGVWLDGNPGWWFGWFGSDILMNQVSMIRFICKFSKRLPYIGSNNCPKAHQPRYPFYRAHAHLTSKRREPWLFGTAVLDKVRESVLTRYRLLPMWWLSTVRMPKVWSCVTLKKTMLPATRSFGKI